MQNQYRKTFIACVVVLPILLFFVPQQFNWQSVSVSRIFLLLLIAPLLEEMTFRGLLQDAVLARTRSYAATLVIVNLLFVALHYNVSNNILYLIAVFGCGIIFGITKVYYGKIIYPIMLHAYYNLCFVLYLLYRIS